MSYALNVEPHWTWPPFMIMLVTRAHIRIHVSNVSASTVDFMFILFECIWRLATHVHSEGNKQSIIVMFIRQNEIESRHLRGSQNAIWITNIYIIYICKGQWGMCHFECKFLPLPFLFNNQINMKLKPGSAREALKTCGARNLLLTSSGTPYHRMNK